MNIVLYSTNSHYWNTSSIQIEYLPSCREQWQKVAKKYSEHKFFVVCQMPGMFLVDVNENSTVEKCENIEYFFDFDSQSNCSKSVIQNQNNSEWDSLPCDAEKIADFILKLKPDLAICATYWVTPFDWLSINDSLVGEKLIQNGVKTLCHPTKTSFMCFDKSQTYNFLSSKGFNVSPAVYINHSLFILDKTKTAILKQNVYKDYIFSQLKKMNYPLIIKDTVGVSSYGMEVANTFLHAKSFLLCKRNNSDRIVEEYIDGLHFGTEIKGQNGNYCVKDPFLFSLNQYGITTPKLSIKIGPVTNEKYRIGELKEMLLNLAKELNFAGTAQVDLIFSKNKWFIIEINPRLSGMSTTFAASEGENLLENVIKNALNPNQGNENPKYFCGNIKYSLLPKETLKELSELPFVSSVMQIYNNQAKQEREKGYCEVIFGKSTTKDGFVKEINLLQEKTAHLTKDSFFDTALKMCELL